MVLNTLFIKLILISFILILHCPKGFGVDDFGHVDAPSSSQMIQKLYELHNSRAAHQDTYSYKTLTLCRSAYKHTNFYIWVLL